LFDPATISLRVLPNGVRGIVKQTHGTGVVAVQVWVRAGSRFETANTTGVSHLIERSVMRSSRNYPATESGGGVSDAIEVLGGVATSQTTRDSTNYGATVAAGFLPSAMRILGDATLFPRLSSIDVEAAKAEVESNLQRRGADPISAISDMAYFTAFARHPYRQPAGGLTQNIAALNSTSVKAYYAQRYTGANISVIVVGDVNPAAAHTLIARYFSAASPTRSQRPNIPTENAPTVFRTATRRGGAARTAVALAFRAPGIGAPGDVVAMDVLQAHWNEGQDAALRRVLQMNAPTEESLEANSEAEAAAPGNNGTSPSNGANAAPAAPTEPATPSASASEPVEALALGYDASFLTQRDPSLFIISLVVEPDARARAVSALLAEVGRVRTQGIDAASLARAKTMLARQYIQQSETVTGQAGALGFYDMISTYEFAVTYLNRVQQVTVNDVKRVARNYLSTTNYVQVAIEPAPVPRARPFPRDNNNSGGITA
jgi:zinc protease